MPGLVLLWLRLCANNEATVFFLGMETPRPNRELDVEVKEDKVVEDDDDVGCVGSSLAFIERFSGASSDDVVDVLGFPISELTSSAKGLPLTVWLRTFVPLLMVLLLMQLLPLVVTVTELLLLIVAGKRSN